MLKLFLITFAIVLVVIALLAVGVFFGRKPIAGSCGGSEALKALGVDECVAGCEQPCEKRLARKRIQQEREADNEH